MPSRLPSSVDLDDARQFTPPPPPRLERSRTPSLVGLDDIDTARANSAYQTQVALSAAPSSATDEPYSIALALARMGSIGQAIVPDLQARPASPGTLNREGLRRLRRQRSRSRTRDPEGSRSPLSTPGLSSRGPSPSSSPRYGGSFADAQNSYRGSFDRGRDSLPRSRNASPGPHSLSRGPSPAPQSRGPSPTPPSPRFSSSRPASRPSSPAGRPQPPRFSSSRPPSPAMSQRYADHTAGSSGRASPMLTSPIAASHMVTSPIATQMTTSPAVANHAPRPYSPPLMTDGPPLPPGAQPPSMPSRSLPVSPVDAKFPGPAQANFPRTSMPLPGTSAPPPPQRPLTASPKSVESEPQTGEGPAANALVGDGYPHIADKVISYLSHEEQINMRLVCRALSDRADAALFHTVTLAQDGYYGVGGQKLPLVPFDQRPEVAGAVQILTALTDYGYTDDLHPAVLRLPSGWPQPSDAPSVIVFADIVPQVPGEWMLMHMLGLPELDAQRLVYNVRYAEPDLLLVSQPQWDDLSGDVRNVVFRFSQYDGAVETCPKPAVLHIYHSDDGAHTALKNATRASADFGLTASPETQINGLEWLHNSRGHPSFLDALAWTIARNLAPSLPRRFTFIDADEWDARWLCTAPAHGTVPYRFFNVVVRHAMTLYRWNRRHAEAVVSNALTFVTEDEYRYAIGEAAWRIETEEVL